jgi:methyl-accepting chemotaxis protein
MEELEMTASEMFDRIVQAGLSPEDSAMVEVAQEFARSLVEQTEAAIAASGLSEAALFDHNYVPVQGTNPQLYRSTLSDWADANWQKILDSAEASHRQVLAAACTDVNGFLPTHLSAKSLKPTGDITHDTQFCRNGRILFDPIDKKAKASDAPYMMAVYRQEGDGKQYRVVRNVYIPLRICGKRWGDFELAYTFDG